MAQIFVGDDTKTYHTKFEIGDIVRIWETGYAYTTFTEAFKMLGIYDVDRLPIKLKDREENWVIVNMIAIRSCLYSGGKYDILCHIKNKKGQSLVIGEQGLKKRLIKNCNTEALKELNNNQIKDLV
jgi:hypothetical protein